MIPKARVVATLAREVMGVVRRSPSLAEKLDSFCLVGGPKAGGLTDPRCFMVRLGWTGLPKPPHVGTVLRAIRARKGLTLLQIEQISGISQTVLSRIEKGKVRPTEESVLKITQALFNDGQIAPGDLKAVYTHLNPEVRSLRYFTETGTAGTFWIDLPPGITLDDIIHLHVSLFIERAIVRRGLKRRDVARQLGMRSETFESLLKRDLGPVPLETIQKLAAITKLPESFLYFGYHREMRFFLEIAIRGARGGTLSHPTPAAFQTKEVLRRFRSHCRTQGESDYLELIESASPSERDAAFYYLDRGHNTNLNRVFYTLKVPAPFSSIEEIRAIDLRARLIERKGRESMDAFMKRHGLGRKVFESTFPLGAAEHVLPRIPKLKSLARAADLPEPVALLWFWPHLAKKVEVLFRC